MVLHIKISPKKETKGEARMRVTAYYIYPKNYRYIYICTNQCQACTTAMFLYCIIFKSLTGTTLDEITEYMIYCSLCYCFNYGTIVLELCGQHLIML